MGYVGMSVAFAFAVAALIGGNLDAQWARWTRPWTTAAWAMLTFGIALGSWWAYYELGWGGWWFWDAVENASFMPWLVATALIHSLAVTEKRGSFKSWTVLLAIMGYSLALLGTFLVRSGVITSVHSFASDPARGAFILVMMAITVSAALGLYAWRAQKVGLGARFSALSRESMLLANNVLLVVAMAAVMLGTLYPLILDALGLGKISVGAPYFNAVYVPIMAVLVFFMGVGPLARWKNDELPALAVRLRWAAGVTVVSAALTAWIGGQSHGGLGRRPADGLLDPVFRSHRAVGTCAPGRRHAGERAAPPGPAAARHGGHDGGAPGGGVSLSRSLGAATGTALFGALVFALMPETDLAHLAEHVRSAPRESVLPAFHTAFLVAAAVAALASFAASRVPRVELK